MIEIILSFLFSTGFAQDLNGYTSKHECRAGNSNCNVDVVSLGQCTPCDDTIDDSMTEATIESLLNDGDDCNCVEPGDYRSKGTIDITANGTSGTRKVMRYIRGGDTDDDPWKQSVANRVRFANLDLVGDFWVIHRISFDPSSGTTIDIDGTDNILNRIYAYDGAVARHVNFNTSGDRNTLQNSVITDTGIPFSNTDVHCVNIAIADDISIVSNEIYNCAGDSIQRGDNSNVRPNTVVENNDMYLTSAYYSDGNGNLDPGGDEACAENALDFKAEGGTAGNHAKLLNNRMWGFKDTDTQCAGTGSNANAIVLNEAGDNSYGEIARNIIHDTHQGMVCANGSPAKWSINFNLVHNTTLQGINLASCDDIEMYLNMFSHIGTRWINIGGSGDKDIRCNTMIDAGTTDGTIAGGVQFSHNTYIDTTNLGESTKNVYTLVTRANSTAVSAGNLMRRSSSATACSSALDPDCYMYEAQNSGTTASSEPTFCTTPDCTFSDGGVTWQAIRGPYQFYRKLLTTPELKTVPFARIYTSAPDYLACPSNFASRNGVGADDTEKPQ